jgi:hypothetical protein
MKFNRRILLRLAVVIAAGLAIAQGSPVSAEMTSPLRMANGHSLKCLDLYNSDTSNGAFVTQWDCWEPGPNQKWVFNFYADRTVDIRTNLNLNKCLDIPNGSTENGALVQLWDCHGGFNQRWSTTDYPCGAGAFCAYRNLNSLKCLDVSGWSTSNGAIIQQWDCHPVDFSRTDNNQLWRSP